MPKLVWDASGEKRYETGIDHGVLYPQANDGTYPLGVVWNGLTSVSESPEGGDPNDFYADNIKYGSLRGTENFGGSIEAYMFPDEFYAMDGTAALVPGVRVSGQTRKTFGLSYRSLIGNDVQGLDAGYKIHLVYGATVSPSEQTHETINDSPEPGTMSWDFTTVPVPVENMKAVSHLVIDSTMFTTDAQKAALTAFEEVLYGRDAQEATAAVYTATTDTTKQAGKTYYTRSGSGTTESPYTYTEFSGDSFAQGTTYYEMTTPAHDAVTALSASLPLPTEVKTLLTVA